MIYNKNGTVHFDLARRYRITVETDDVYYAGTDANVFITLYGSSGSSSEILLSSINDIFERGEYV